MDPNHGTHLVVRNHYHALGKRELHHSIRSFLYLVGNRRIAADSDCCWPPPLCHGRGQEAEGLLRQGHVGIVEIAIDPVKRRTDELGDVDADSGLWLATCQQAVFAKRKGMGTYATQPAMK